MPQAVPLHRPWGEGVLPTRLTQNAEVLDELLALGCLTLLPDRLAGREAQIWLVDGDAGLAVLRRLDPGLGGGAPIEEDRRWQHRFLTRLAMTGFPAPVPIGAFDGASVVLAGDGAVWELLSFIDGTEVGWSAQPGMEQIGAQLAHFHDAAQDITVPDQRPTAVPLVRVPELLRRPSGVANHELLDWCRALGDELAADLEAAGHNRLPVSVIHGDFTNHNVIAAGVPVRARAVIDFGLAPRGGVRRRPRLWTVAQRSTAPGRGFHRPASGGLVRERLFERSRTNRRRRGNDPHLHLRPRLTDARQVPATRCDRHGASRADPLASN